MILDNMHDMMDWGKQSIMFEMNLWALMIIGGIIVLIVYIWIATYVHKDAIKRDIPNPGVWLLIALLFHIGGLFIYLIVRGSYSSTNTNNAKMNVEKVQTYQTVNPYKQIQVEPVAGSAATAKFCPMCGNKLRENAAFCAICGSKI
jgi:hypothetical protein